MSRKLREDNLFFSFDDQQSKTISPPDLSHYLKAIEEEPFDVLEFCGDWMDDGMRLVFAAGAIIAAINFAKQTLIGARSVAIYGFFWNYFDALGALLTAVQDYQNAANAKRHTGAKYALASLNLFGSAQLTLGTTLTILATNGVLIGTAASVASPLAAVTFAVCMYISAIKEAYLLAQAIKKTDPLYLLKDRIIKCHNLDKKIEKAGAAGDSEKKAKLEEQQKVLYLQAMSIACAEFRDTRSRKLREAALAIFKDHPELKRSKYYHLFVESELREPTDTDNAFVQYMQEKQWAKVRKHAFGVVTWTLAAVGMSLIAASIFFPPLMIAGVVVALAAATCKMVEVCELDKRAYNLFAKKKLDISMDNFVVNALARRQKRRLVYEKFENQLDGVPRGHKGEYLDRETRVKLHLAYTLSQVQKEGRHRITEKKFVEHVMALSWWKRRTVLNGAMSTYIERETLKQCAFANRLSQKDKKRYVANSVRSDYRFFSTPVEQHNVSDSPTSYARI